MTAASASAAVARSTRRGGTLGANAGNRMARCSFAAMAEIASGAFAARYGADATAKNGVWRAAVIETKSTGSSSATSRSDTGRARSAVTRTDRMMNANSTP